MILAGPEGQGDAISAEPENAMKRLLAVLGSLGLCLAGVLAFADRRWRSRSAGLEARLRRARPGAKPHAFSEAELAGLPEPVARYFQSVLAIADGQPVVRRARLVERGEFLVKPTRGVWRPFHATQSIAIEPPGFLWDARVRVAPGLSVRVRDSFVEGAGGMHASALGLFPVISIEGTAGIASAALQRYLAEAAWIPLALLPRYGVAWAPLDGSSARATLAAGSTTVSIDFRFGEDGLLRSVFAPARSRQVGDRSIPTPWQGRFSDYAWRGGMRIPLACEAEWLLPAGPRPYFRCAITDIAYE